jgi:hypothetical protein
MKNISPRKLNILNQTLDLALPIYIPYDPDPESIYFNKSYRITKFIITITFKKKKLVNYFIK